MDPVLRVDKVLLHLKWVTTSDNAIVLVVVVVVTIERKSQVPLFQIRGKVGLLCIQLSSRYLPTIASDGTRMSERCDPFCRGLRS
jgi:hypothetical protein